MQNSEWILNERGAIYHLNVLKEEVFPRIITVGDPERVTHLSKFFDQVFHQSRHREFNIISGRIGNNNLTLLSTGMGTDNIDIALTELDGLFNYQSNQFTELEIIRFGTSGSIQEDINPGEILITEEAIGFDNLLNFYAVERNDDRILDWKAACQQYHLPEPSYSIKTDLSKWPEFNGLKTGITATFPGFYGPQGREIRIPSRIKMKYLNKISLNGEKISNLEMETAGIYALSSILGHKYLSINVILANRIKGTFEKDPNSAVESAFINTLLG